MIPSGEALGTLDLIKYITTKIKYIESSEIMVFINNRTLFNKYNHQIHRESEVAIEAAEIITEIRNEVQKASIEIKIQLSKNKP